MTLSSSYKKDFHFVIVGTVSELKEISLGNSQDDD